MTETTEESIGDKARKPVSYKALGVVYLMIAILCLAVGYIAHVSQTVFLSLEVPMIISTWQLDMMFIEYVFVGLFTGIFFVLGIYYLMRSSKKPAET